MTIHDDNEYLEGSDGRRAEVQRRLNVRRRRQVAMTGAAAVVLVVAGALALRPSDPAPKQSVLAGEPGEGTTSTTEDPTSSTVTSAPDPTTTDQTTTSAPPTTGVPETTTTTEAPATTAPPGPTAPTWDEIKNAEIPSLCDHPPTRLVDGKHQEIAPGMGMFELKPTFDHPVYSGIVSGVPSNDAGPLTAVVASCNAGGVSWPNIIVFFSSGGRYYGMTDLWEDGVPWEGTGMVAPGREGVFGIYVHEGVFGVLTTAELPGDAACCPSHSATIFAHAASGRIVIDEVLKEGGD